MHYRKIFKEQDSIVDDILIAKQREAKYIKKLVKQLKLESHSNKNARADFAKIIFQIALSSDPYARKFIKKVSDFISYFEDDFYISEDEWRKLNNSNV